MDIGKGIRDIIEIYRQNFVVLLLATLVTTIGSVITFGILAGPLVAGMVILCLKLIRGESGQVNEVFAHFDKFKSTFIIVVVMWLSMIITTYVGRIPLIGTVVNFFVGPSVGIIFVLAIGYVVDRNYTPMDALQGAVRCFMSNPIMIWLYSFVIGILSSIGFIAFGIGIIFTMPIGTLGMVIAYHELSKS